MADTYSFDDAPDATAEDARRLLIRAARLENTTVEGGAYKARRTIKEPDPKMKPGDSQHIVRLRERIGNTRIVDIAVTPFDKLRDDWKRPSPVEPGEVVLPEDDYDLEDVFVDPTVLPGTEFVQQCNE